MKWFHRLLNLSLILTIALTAASYYFRRQLPPKASLVPDLLKAPIQNNGMGMPFSFRYRDTEYEVSPVADYELWGLVVSHNKIGSVWDAYHTQDSVDLKDICVIWGDNLASGIYSKGDYSSGSWTCYWWFDKDFSQFNQSEIANNHLLTSDPQLQQRIRNLRIGDQVHVTGKLVNYKNLSNGWYRGTSVTREDQGNTACEVVYVDELDLLKPGNVQWYWFYLNGLWVALGLIILKFLIGMAEARRDVRGMKNMKGV